MLTTVEKVKLYLGINGTDEDGLLDLLVQAASTQIESYCDRKFEACDYTEIKEVYGRKLILLDNFPVLAEPTVKLDNTVITDFALYPDSGMLEGNWSGKYEISYRAGYETIPADLEFACIQLVAAMYDRRGSDHVVTESIGPLRAEYADDIPQHIKWVLDRYRKPVV